MKAEPSSRPRALPKNVLVCFEDHAPDGLVWAIKEGRQWSRHRYILISVMLESVYRGKNARQPKAYFRPRAGAYVERYEDGSAWVRPAR